MSRKEVLEEVRRVQPGKDFIWDGVDENERPATKDEMRAGIDAARKSRGRPAGSDKTQIALRIDNDTLSAFRATGKGWQSRMNSALRDWLATHSSV